MFVAQLSSVIIRREIIIWPKPNQWINEHIAISTECLKWPIIDQTLFSCSSQGCDVPRDNVVAVVDVVVVVVVTVCLMNRALKTSSHK